MITDNIICYRSTCLNSNFAFGSNVVEILILFMLLATRSLVF